MVASAVCAPFQLQCRRRVCASQPRPACRLICKAATKDAEQVVDGKEVVNLLGGTALQVTTLAAVLTGLDKLDVASILPDAVPTSVLVWFLFFGLSLRSRVLSPFDARRPNSSGAGKGFGDRVRPEWCPPPAVFAIVWSTMALLRATSAMMVWEASGGQLAAAPILAYTTSLAFGDTFNYIANTQCRLGVSAVFNSVFVWPSVALQVYLYFDTDTTAGLTIASLLIWLTVANVLIWSIWDLNGKQPLLPLVGMSASSEGTN